MGKGALYIVATPIGNLEDVTLRALRVLKEADLIAAEDTRQTRKLLAHYGISTPMTSLFEHNERAKASGIIDGLLSGKDVALVSDAGTPGLSDPGFRLISRAVAESIRVVPVPGPSAIITALSASGLPLDSFTFRGFVPAGGADRKRFFLSMAVHEATYVMFESARRLEAALKCAFEVLGNVEVVIGREMTKLHEELIRGRIAEVSGMIKGRDIKGEVTIIIRTSASDAGEAKADPRGRIEELLKSGFRLKDVVKAVADEFDMPRGEAYKEALRVKEAVTAGDDD